MHFYTTLPFLLAVWNIASSIPTRAAPLPYAAMAKRSQEVRGRSMAYDGGGQMPFPSPSPLSSPPTPATSSPGSDVHRPMTFKMPQWVTAPYRKVVVDEDRNVFNTTLQGITLAKKHSLMGNNNAGVYSVASFDSSFAQLFPLSIAAQEIDPSRLLVKVLKQIDDDMIAEVKALKIVGQFVASGMLNLPVAGTPSDKGLFQLKPVIVMLKMPGKPLTSTPEYILEQDIEIKRRMMSDTLKLMCDRVGNLALEHGFVHRDNIIGNVLVINQGTQVVDVNIIDWGGKYLSSIRDDVTWDDLMGWCHHRWDLHVWEESL